MQQIFEHLLLKQLPNIFIIKYSASICVPHRDKLHITLLINMLLNKIIKI